MSERIINNYPPSTLPWFSYQITTKSDDDHQESAHLESHNRLAYKYRLQLVNAFDAR